MARHAINFTKAALDRLPIPDPGKRTEVFDTKAAGLHVRITANGDKTFCVKRWVKAHGKSERITIGRFPGVTIEQARNAAGRIGAAIAEGRNPAEALREKRAELTLGELFELYLERYALPRGKKTAAAMREMWERYLGVLPPQERKPRGKLRTKHRAGVNWQKRKLSMIKPAEVVRLHTDLGRAGVKTTANRVVELVSALFHWASRSDLFKGANPAAKIEPFQEVKRDRFIQADEMPRFFSALAEEPAKDVRDFVLLSLLTGARRGNVLAMRWDDVSLDLDEWRIPETKNGEAQRIPLSPEAVEVLKSRKPQRGEPTGYVFSSPSASGYMTNPKRGWRRILDRAEIAELRIHDLRRSLGSWQAKTGASLAIIGKSLGHKSASATMIYARLDQDPVRQSVNVATAAMLKAAGVKKSAGVVKIGKGKTG